ncbi:tRNA dihydrouridine(20/20a) synthase DusA [Saccharobesus litoralis]|uniref:tRNA-dihydrouridine(20/20a) synthase n=1 Tax=Saccharobesus litoralis TaxID=2172099 RepID=A0A2S0VWM2_9ALTE|nr:tRNA dihydrouridine(20/20a) synthase DusA [Saccharobesus litoralis]AWB68619.1 tRNA dihydrouridine(20/20a) synthase DusA [Saccharobesus litoralis]
MKNKDRNKNNFPRSDRVDHTFSVAPMLDWTDKHCRYFYRLMTKHAVLYTEMVTTGAVIHGQNDYLAYDQAEHPVVLQLGGSDPVAMAECAIKATDYGYDEININVGCPSDRVQNGAFGACLMAQPQLVAECVEKMRSVTSTPITVKTRIGIDDFDSYEFLTDFVKSNIDAGCEHFIIHARKAWLQGLSPKQNREIPELNYSRVYQLKNDFPQLTISLNGGVETFEQIDQHLPHVDGVMLGRAVYQNPYMLTEVDARLYGQAASTLSREEVALAIMPYIEQQVSNDPRATTWHIVRHMLNLFNGQPGARAWRRYLSENARKHPKNADIINLALNAMKG